MGRLLKLQLKENIKSLIWIWIIPLVLSAGFIYINRIFDNFLTQAGMGLSTLLLFLGLGASMLIVIYLDYQRFFGREAIFYQSLPISSMSYTRSRFFNFLISFILISLVMFVDFSIISAAVGEFFLVEIKEVLSKVFQILGDYPKESILFVLTSIFSIASSIFVLIFSINFGSQKAFKSMGIFGPIIIFILTNLAIMLVMFLLSNLVETMFNGYFEQFINPRLSSIEEIIRGFRPLLYISLATNIILAIIFAFLSNNSQEKRLSV